MKAFKILLRLKEEENKWGTRPLDEIQVGEVMAAFKFKNSADEIEELKKGDTVYFQDEYAKKLVIDGKELISTNPTNLICQK